MTSTSRQTPALAAAACAAALAGTLGTNFVHSPSLQNQLQGSGASELSQRSSGHRLSGVSAPHDDGKSSAPMAVAALATASTLALVAKKQSKSRASRVAMAAGITTTDGEGRDRFVVPGPAQGMGDGSSAPASSGPFDPTGELGVQAPLGFWDPAGFCDDIDEMGFKRLRSCELKHGRIAMMATIGYIWPLTVGKLPGYLSPSAGLKFADVPHGLEAISKVPNAGWIQIFLFASLIEFGLGPDGIEEWKSRPAGDYDKGFLGMFGPVTDDAKRERALNAEIANGRLAMAAITGMVLQNGITGTTGDAMWFPASALARRA